MEMGDKIRGNFELKGNLLPGKTIQFSIFRIVRVKFPMASSAKSNKVVFVRIARVFIFMVYT